MKSFQRRISTIESLLSKKKKSCGEYNGIRFEDIIREQTSQERAAFREALLNLKAGGSPKASCFKVLDKTARDAINTAYVRISSGNSRHVS